MTVLMCYWRHRDKHVRVGKSSHDHLWQLAIANWQSPMPSQCYQCIWITFGCNNSHYHWLSLYQRLNFGSYHHANFIVIDAVSNNKNSNMTILSFSEMQPCMMTSSNGNICRVTGPLCGEFTCHRWIPLTKTSDAGSDVFFNLCLNKRLSKQSCGWWFETPSCSLWRYCNTTWQFPF